MKSVRPRPENVSIKAATGRRAGARPPQRRSGVSGARQQRRQAARYQALWSCASVLIQVRELILSSEGVTLADIYTAGGEVLMGTMRWEKERAERVASEIAEIEGETARACASSGAVMQRSRLGKRRRR